MPAMSRWPGRSAHRCKGRGGQVVPKARAAIVSVVARASLSAETVRARLAALPGLSHLTLELRSV